MQAHKKHTQYVFFWGLLAPEGDDVRFNPYRCSLASKTSRVCRETEEEKGGGGGVLAVSMLGCFDLSLSAAGGLVV